eukprot:7335304-Pyramimonas_sp.AAC.1
MGPAERPSDRGAAGEPGATSAADGQAKTNSNKQNHGWGPPKGRAAVGRRASLGRPVQPTDKRKQTKNKTKQFGKPGSRATAGRRAGLGRP